jgi:hypothetical protein
MSYQDVCDKFADQLRAERLRSAGLEERIASLESTIADLSAGFASKMATALEAMETKTRESIAGKVADVGEREWTVEGYKQQGISSAYCEGWNDCLESAVDAVRSYARPASTTCSDLVAFADGELPTDRAEAFREHLQSCGTCATALPETMMVAARLSELKR